MNVIARLEFELSTILQSRALTITPRGHPQIIIEYNQMSSKSFKNQVTYKIFAYK